MRLAIGLTRSTSALPLPVCAGASLGETLASGAVVSVGSGSTAFSAGTSSTFSPASPTIAIGAPRAAVSPSSTMMRRTVPSS
jgi:hypothetical protein